MASYIRQISYMPLSKAAKIQLQFLSPSRTSWTHTLSGNPFYLLPLLRQGFPHLPLSAIKVRRNLSLSLPYSLGSPGSLCVRHAATYSGV